MSIQLVVSSAGYLNSPWGHFQVVGPDGNEIEVQPSGLGAGNWVVTIRDHDTYIDNSWPTPDTYHTYGIQNGVVQEGFYNSIALLSFGGQTESQQWELLLNIANALAVQQTNIQYQNEILSDENGDPYVSESGTQNSNTFISTLLYVIGIDLADYVNGTLPSILQGLNFQTVPGYTHNVLFDPLSGEPISLTLSGTDGNDFIRTGNGNDILNGGLGNDVLDGGENADGSADLDTLSYANLSSGVLISLDQSATGDLGANFTATGAGPSGDWTDRFTNFEDLNLLNFVNVIGSGFNDNITGDDQGNIIDGALCADQIGGGLGEDTLIQGGEGYDIGVVGAECVIIPLVDLPDEQSYRRAGVQMLEMFTESRAA